jgi:hypothetical protein
MKVVRHEGPGIDDEFTGPTQFSQPLKKIFTVLICAEYGCSFDASAHDVMQGSGRIESWLSWHIDTLHRFASSVNKLF